MRFKDDIAQGIANIAFESPNSATFLVDKEGYVILINKLYLRILNCKQKDIVGRHLSDVMPWETVTLDVLETKQERIAYRWGTAGLKGAASSYPVIKDGELWGCFTWTVLLDLNGAQRMIERLKREHHDDFIDGIESFGTWYTFDSIIGDSPNTKELKNVSRQVAAHGDITVLLEGESGTGKELFAQAMHNASPRAGNPFVRVNCAAIPENLLESELFGYEEGAFTNAKKGGKLGKFELAGGGTIFLDEIGELPLPMQSKLLVVLQEKVIERIGGEKPIKIKCRVIAATNRNLAEMVKTNLFREDLYYRLNVVKLTVPPLRERKEDLPLLIQHLMRSINIREKTNIDGISEEVRSILYQYKYPGNVRELQNILERAMIITHIKKFNVINIDNLNRSMLDEALIDEAIEERNGKGLNSILEEVEKRIIELTLSDTDCDLNKTAEILGINKSSLYRRLKKYDL